MAKCSLVRTRSREWRSGKGYLVPRRRQFVKVNGVGGAAELARSDAVNLFRKLQPRNRERGPQRLVLLIPVSFSHTQAVFGDVAIVFDVTHRLVLTRYFVTTTQRI